MIEKEIKISNKLGLHARAAAKLSHLANGFESDIFIKHSSDQVNAKSLLGILTLGATFGDAIMIIASGQDEESALEKISELFERKFDEES